MSELFNHTPIGLLQEWDEGQVKDALLSIVESDQSVMVVYEVDVTSHGKLYHLGRDCFYPGIGVDDSDIHINAFYTDQVAEIMRLSLGGPALIVLNTFFLEKEEVYP